MELSENLPEVIFFVAERRHGSNIDSLHSRLTPECSAANTCRAAQNKSTSEIAFVVMLLNCQLKVVPERISLILSKNDIEHAEETFRRARVVSNARNTKET